MRRTTGKIRFARRIIQHLYPWAGRVRWAGPSCGANAATYTSAATRSGQRAAACVAIGPPMPLPTSKDGSEFFGTSSQTRAAQESSALLGAAADRFPIRADINCFASGCQIHAPEEAPCTNESRDWTFFRPRVSSSQRAASILRRWDWVFTVVDGHPADDENRSSALTSRRALPHSS